MAHTIAVPVRFHFETIPCNWYLGTASPIGYLWTYGEDSIVLVVKSPPKYAGLRINFGVTALAARLIERLPREDKRLHMSERALNQMVRKQLGSEVLEIILCDHSEGDYPKNRKIDPWTLRDEFLRVPKGSQALLKFLNRWGVWDRASAPRLIVGGEKKKWEPSASLQDGFWNEQDSLRTRLLNPSSVPGSLDYLTSGDSAFLEAYSAYCFDCIEASITVDFFRRTRFRKCARRDCGVPYTVSTKHKRRYCSWYCGHLESVRRGRRSKRSTRNAPKEA